MNIEQSPYFEHVVQSLLKHTTFWHLFLEPHLLHIPLNYRRVIEKSNQIRVHKMVQIGSIYGIASLGGNHGPIEFISISGREASPYTVWKLKPIPAFWLWKWTLVDLCHLCQSLTKYSIIHIFPLLNSRCDPWKLQLCSNYMAQISTYGCSYAKLPLKKN